MICLKSYDIIIAKKVQLQIFNWFFFSILYHNLLITTMKPSFILLHQNSSWNLWSQVRTMMLCLRLVYWTLVRNYISRNIQSRVKIMHAWSIVSLYFTRLLGNNQKQLICSPHLVGIHLVFTWCFTIRKSIFEYVIHSPLTQ